MPQVMIYRVHFYLEDINRINEARCMRAGQHLDGSTRSNSMNHLNIQFCFLRRLYHVIIARIEREVSYNRDDLGSNRGQTKLLIERVDIVLQGGTGNGYYEEYCFSFAGLSLDSERLQCKASTQLHRR